MAAAGLQHHQASLCCRCCCLFLPLLLLLVVVRAQKPVPPCPLGRAAPAPSALCAPAALTTAQAWAPIPALLLPRSPVASEWRWWTAMSSACWRGCGASAAIRAGALASCACPPAHWSQPGMPCGLALGMRPGELLIWGAGCAGEGRAAKQGWLGSTGSCWMGPFCRRHPPRVPFAAWRPVMTLAARAHACPPCPRTHTPVCTSARAHSPTTTIAAAALPRQSYHTSPLVFSPRDLAAAALPRQSCLQSWLMLSWIPTGRETSTRCVKRGRVAGQGSGAD